jgi:ParB family chromosome partitioning protein
MSQNEANPKNNENRKALGRGLAALLGEQKVEQKSEQKPMDQPIKSSHNSHTIGNQEIEIQPILNNSNRPIYDEVELSKISANPDQPRKIFNTAKIEELASSLKEHGLVQPIVVKRLSSGDYQIIAGERRWRAAKVAGLTKLPVIIKQSDYSQTSQDLAALVENIQREDLSPIELATSYDRMIRQYGYTQEKLADKLGVSRVAVANTLRLLKLPDPVKEMVNRKSISEGHSRALLSLATEEEIILMANEILEKGLTVRDVENRVKMKVVSMARMPDIMGGGSGPGIQKLNEFSALEDELRHILGTKVSLRGNNSKGTVEIYFSGKDSLNRIIHQLRSTVK